MQNNARFVLKEDYGTASVEDLNLACQYCISVILQARSEEVAFSADKTELTLGILQAVVLVTDVLSL